jgi:hypothetical protein
MPHTAYGWLSHNVPGGAARASAGDEGRSPGWRSSAGVGGSQSSAETGREPLGAPPQHRGGFSGLLHPRRQRRVISDFSATRGSSDGPCGLSLQRGAIGRVSDRHGRWRPATTHPPAAPFPSPYPHSVRSHPLCGSHPDHPFARVERDPGNDAEVINGYQRYARHQSHAPNASEQIDVAGTAMAAPRCGVKAPLSPADLTVRALADVLRQLYGVNLTVITSPSATG